MAAYVEEFARAAIHFLQMGGPAGEAQRFGGGGGGGVEGFGKRPLDCSLGLTGQLSEIWSREWQ